jgi:segregation and condensation protein B
LIRRPAGWPERVVVAPATRLRLHAPTRRSAPQRARVRPAAVARVEAVLMVADGPLTARRIAQHAMMPDAADAKPAIDWLNAAYEAGGTAFRVERIAAGYRLLTRPELAPWLDRLHRRNERLKLSPPALETLTIVAYRQPCTRADVEAVRGVQSAEMLKHLMERGLVRIAGEDDSLGRPYLYETTKQFLELFGLRSVADLPRSDELSGRSAGTSP